MTILSALQAPGAVDEIGVGIVRDAFADKLFPGTSTLLTKARYFFFVPYILKTMEECRDSSRQNAKKLRNDFNDLEKRCAQGLLACVEANEGIIGRVSLQSQKWVTRGPGEIYWASLRTLGFMRPKAPEGMHAYFAWLSDERMRAKPIKIEQTDDGLSDDAVASESVWNVPRLAFEEWKRNWGDWKNKASIELTETEAAFFAKQIVRTQPNSLYALLISDEQLRAIALSSNESAENDDSIMGQYGSAFHRFMISGGYQRIAECNQDLARSCSLADGFSEFVLGCRIAYNMQIAGLEKYAQSAWQVYEPDAVRFAKALDLDVISEDLDLRKHAGYASLKAFLNDARDRMLSSDLDGLKTVVADRERKIKGTRAKIGRNDIGDIAWRGGMRLPYRFNNAINIVREISEAGGCKC